MTKLDSIRTRAERVRVPHSRLGAIVHVRLYFISKNEKLVGDDTWFDYNIKVLDKKITISINGKVVTEYEEKEGDTRGGGMEGRWIKDGGTFAFQAHDPGCEAFYKDIMVKPLP